MFDLLIFTQYPRAHAPKRLKEESEKLGLSCRIKSYKYTDLDNLPEAKFVILREPTASKNIYDFRDKILKYYVSSGSKVLNSESYLKWSILDKKTQEQEFKKAGIPHIHSLSHDSISNLSYPFIAKAKLGSHGDSVYKIENSNDLEEVLKKYKKEDLLFQEFQNSGFDLRVIVINYEVVGIMKRTPKKGEFLSNFSQGGRVERFEIEIAIEKEIKNIAIKTAKHFKLEYVGVDIMLGNPFGKFRTGEWKVLEVNRACQFQGFEKAIEVNIPNLILKYMMS